MYRKSIIIGIQGIQLTNEERYLIKTKKPWGVILFSRNIKNIFQLKYLVRDIKKRKKNTCFGI